MDGLTNINIYIANFYNTNGEYVGSQKIKQCWNASKIKTFEYDGGTYNVKVKASRSFLCPFPYLFNYFHYSYEIGTPDPLEIKAECKALFSATDYNAIIKSDILVKLNNARQNNLLDFLKPQYIIPALAIIGAIIYFANGGTLTGGSPIVNETVQAVVQNETVQNLVSGAVKG